ncbi:MAG TPA: hypothetical protein VFZ34_17435 [Blastocatellia bacterium]|nr:hypothetical protein [Blastocatellia bacterium]
MNCSEFENIVIELAQSEMRSVLLNVEMKQRGWQHAQSCLPCAGRLKTEQSLSRSLRAVATSDQSLNAPATVEAVLLAAFRTQQEAVSETPNVIASSFEPSLLQRWFAQWKWVFVPAALTALALIVFAVSQGVQTTAPPQTPIATTTVTPALFQSVESPAPEQVTAPMPEAEELRALTAPAPMQRRPTPIKANLNPMPRRGNVTVDVGAFFVDEPEVVSAKDFLVFDYAQTLPPADSTQLMRVRMPRERLASLGIPLPRETRNENFVNADLLVGSDGVPRAIRVVNR